MAVNSEMKRKLEKNKYWKRIAYLLVLLDVKLKLLLLLQRKHFINTTEEEKKPRALHFVNCFFKRIKDENPKVYTFD